MKWPFQRASVPAKPRAEPRFTNNAFENPAVSLSNPPPWLLEWGGGVPTHAGVVVSEQSAVRSTAAFRCIALLAGIVATLRLKIYENSRSGRKTATNHRLYPLLHDAPNDLMSAFIWKELIGAHLLTNGNHYSIIEYDGAARIVGLLPVRPQDTHVERIKGRNRYTFHFNDGVETLDQDDVIHVPGLGFDGLKGLSPIGAVGREAIGISLALEEFVGRMHSQGAKPSGVVTMKKPLDPAGFKRLRQELEMMYSGVQNAGRTVILDNEMTWSAMQLTPEDAQTLDERKFQVIDICRVFGVPPHLVGEVDTSTSWGTGIEQQTIAFLIFSANPYLSRIEAELNRKLLKPPYYCEFDRDTLNAIDSKTRADLFASGIQNGVYTPNEVRRKVNMPDMPGGDQLLINGTLKPLVQAPAPVLNDPPAHLVPDSAPSTDD